MSMFMDALRELEAAADARYGGTRAVLFRRDRARPRSREWSVWVDGRPETYEAEDAQAAMRRALRAIRSGVNPG